MKSFIKAKACVLSVTILTVLTVFHTQVFANGGGKVLGKVKLAGADGKVTSKPDLLVSAKGGIQNVVLTIEGIAGAFRSDPISIDQKNKMYNPRISVSMVGNELTFLNSDAILHNVHGYSGVETLYNFAMPKFLKEKATKLAEPGLKLIRCDVHQEMIAYVVVAENPYYAISNEAGLFQIDGVPPGTYKIKAWHEKLGSLEREVTITNDEKSAVIFEFSPEGN